jgi:hypothetical protein
MVVLKQLVGIFFKLSHDWKGLYGSDALAIKAAEHELKGTMAYLDCRIQALRTPLMALVRYRGYTVIAQSILPISKQTLKYGSNDGGRTYHKDDPELNAKFELAAKMINIKVRSRVRSHGIPKCLDLQVVLLEPPRLEPR